MHFVDPHTWTQSSATFARTWTHDAGIILKHTHKNIHPQYLCRSFSARSFQSCTHHAHGDGSRENRYKPGNSGETARTAALPDVFSPLAMVCLAASMAIFSPSQPSPQLAHATYCLYFGNLFLSSPEGEKK